MIEEEFENSAKSMLKLLNFKIYVSQISEILYS